ncbi:MAG TPA: cytochrome b [Casimicrobiaceae bacterium]|nr:cytochrome b [Casimicrobiaceae bacterium]
MVGVDYGKRDTSGRTTGYDTAAITFHWAIALLIFVAFPLGLYMRDLPLSPDKLRLYSYHKWLGVTVVMLTCARALWRSFNPTALPGTLSRWERIVAPAVHYLLYALMFMAPISGWLLSSAQGFQTVWFGIIPLPDLLGRDKAMAHLLEQVHRSLNYFLLVLVAGHTVAALRHHFVTNDEVLGQMLPFLRGRLMPRRYDQRVCK